MLTERIPLTKTEAFQINAVTLAFVGDAVYSLYVRERLTLEVGGKSSDLQRTASKIVSAKGQSEFLNKVLPVLTEEGFIRRFGDPDDFDFEEDSEEEPKKSLDPEETKLMLIKSLATKLFDLHNTMQNMEERLRIISQQIIQIEAIQKKRFSN